MIQDRGNGNDSRDSIVAILSGTGTSVGVPMIGCRCRVCRSADPRDRRMRASAVFIAPDGRTAVLDTGPDFREQMLKHGIERLDAVLLSHEHADHVAGIDDVRPFNFRAGRSIPVYGSAETLGWVRSRFDYIWNAPQEGGGLPKIELRPQAPDAEFAAAGMVFRPLPVRHGVIGAWGYRVGDFAYVSDLSEIPPDTLERLRGLRTLVVGGVQYAPHATHFCVADALRHIEALAPARAYLTHINHEILHGELAERLPPGVQPAHDGLTVQVTGGAAEGQ